jgi:hypothetical protein
MADNRRPSEESGSGDLDYGAHKPTGGTSANTGKVNPQSPTSGTENFHPDRKRNHQTTPNQDDEQDKSASGETPSTSATPPQK